jgi:hypothetical protein
MHVLKLLRKKERVLELKNKKVTYNLKVAITLAREKTRNL